MVCLQAIKQKWNACLRKAGYLDNYAAAHNHYNANSTDIHSVNDIENLSAYILKALTESIEAAEKVKKTGPTRIMDIGAEMAKDVQNAEETEGKIWGCSELLAASHYVAFHMNTRHHDYIEHLEKEGKVKRFSDDTGFWSVFHFTDCSPPDIMNAAERNYITDYLDWQFKRPSKSAPGADWDAWAHEMPFLIYNN